MRTLIGILMLTSLPLSAWAGGTAVLRSSAEGRTTEMQVEYLGDRTRFNVQGQGDSYMIMRDGKAYAVTQGMVMDLSGMAKMMGSQMQANPGSMASNVDRYMGMHATGRSETVAGIRGDVYVVEYADENGQKHADEVVLSSDKRAWEFSQAMMKMGRSMARAAGIQERAGETEMWNTFNGKRAGVLRYGTQMQVVSLSSSDPASSRFELPSAPTQMPNLGALLSGANAGASASGSANTGAAGTTGGTVDLDAFLGGKAQRQQDRVEQRTDQEVDKATDKAVDKALNKAFDKLFGG
jgi:hypothetical protein